MGSNYDLVPPGGMYARVPIPAFRYLATRKLKAECRVLFALCLHLGKDSNVVFPGYPTIALYANVSENNIKKALSKLAELGFIEIEKRKMGRKSQNYYSILPAAFIDNRKTGEHSKRTLDGKITWICRSCFNYVSSSDAEFVCGRDWDGKTDNYWKHTLCLGSGRIEPESPGILEDRKNHLLWLEICRKQEEMRAESEPFNPPDPIVEFEDPWGNN